MTLEQLEKLLNIKFDLEFEFTKNDGTKEKNKLERPTYIGSNYGIIYEDADTIQLFKDNKETITVDPKNKEEFMILLSTVNPLEKYI